MMLAAVLLTLSITLIVGCSIPNITTPGAATGDPAATDDPAETLFDAKKIEEIIKLFQSVSLGEIDTDRITDDLIKGFVEGSGDVYASYMTEEEYAEYNASYAADYVGIGVTVNRDANTGAIRIIEVLPGAPAEEAGFCLGDEIVGVNGAAVDLTDPDVLEAVALLIRGEEGTFVEVTVKRGNETLTLRSERRRVERRTVHSTLFSYGGRTAAYVMITSFDTATPIEFKNAIDAAETAGADFFLFDLRNNPGGLLSSVTSMLTYLLPHETLLTTIEYSAYESALYSGEYRNEDHFADSGLAASLPQLDITATGRVYYNQAYSDHTVSLPMAILVNGYSASASELFTSVLRDYELATVVGENTYGKGCMQVTYPLSDGTALKLTTAYYTPPCGINYDVTTEGPVGIAPHIEVIFTDEENRVSLYTADHKDDRQFVAAFNALTQGEKLPVPTPDKLS